MQRTFHYLCFLRIRCSHFILFNKIKNMSHGNTVVVKILKNFTARVGHGPLLSKYVWAAEQKSSINNNH